MFKFSKEEGWISWIVCSKVNILGKGIIIDSFRKGNEFGIFEKYEYYFLWLE